MKSIKLSAAFILTVLLASFFIHQDSVYSQINPPCGWCTGVGKNISTQQGQFFVCPHEEGDQNCIYPCICPPDK